MKYPVLIGRNALQALGLPVIVNKDVTNNGEEILDAEIYVDGEEE
jgi:hypothetical protein